MGGRSEDLKMKNQLAALTTAFKVYKNHQEEQVKDSVNQIMDLDASINGLGPGDMDRRSELEKLRIEAVEVNKQASLKLLRLGKKVKHAGRPLRNVKHLFVQKAIEVQAFDFIGGDLQGVVVLNGVADQKKAAQDALLEALRARDKEAERE